MSLKWYNISIILISGGINMAQFKIITILIGLVLVTVFAVQNSANVIIKFLIYHFTVSQALIIILSVAVGVVIGLMVGLTRNFKTSKNIKKLSRENTDVQTKISSLETENENLLLKNNELKQKIESLSSVKTDEPNQI
jgi:putative membrane protein